MGRHTQSAIILTAVVGVFALWEAMGMLTGDGLPILALGTLGVALAMLAAAAVGRWWLSRARVAVSDGSGALVFSDGSTGRTVAPAPQGSVRVFRDAVGDAAGYREDGDARRFRVELVAKGDARVRGICKAVLKVAAVSALCFACMFIRAWFGEMLAMS